MKDTAFVIKKLRNNAFFPLNKIKPFCSPSRSHTSRTVRRTYLQYQSGASTMENRWHQATPRQSWEPQNTPSWRPSVELHTQPHSLRWHCWWLNRCPCIWHLRQMPKTEPKRRQWLQCPIQDQNAVSVGLISSQRLRWADMRLQRAAKTSLRPLSGRSCRQFHQSSSFQSSSQVSRGWRRCQVAISVWKRKRWELKVVLIILSVWS